MTATGKGRVIRRMALQVFEKDGSKIITIEPPFSPEEEQLLKQATHLANVNNDLWKYFKPASKPASSSGNGGDDGGGGTGGESDELGFDDLNM